MKACLVPEVVRDRQAELQDALFCNMGADGVVARTRLYEDVVERLAALISEYRCAETEILRFPPVMSRNDLQRHGYLQSFPNLIACACCLHGNEDQIRQAAQRIDGGWAQAVEPTELVLSPAACYPVYPIAASRGPVPACGLSFDVAAECFRREPSSDLSRLQSFRMREYVRVGSKAQVDEFRREWLQKGAEIAGKLVLPYKIDQASDPFFGRTGQIMAASQIQMALKFELVIPRSGTYSAMACMSFNNHLDHFGAIWDIKGQDSTPAYTGCVAFGMDRLALALFWHHGSDLKQWPREALDAL